MGKCRFFRTTTPISSLVWNYNSHQPLSLVFSWLLVEEGGLSAGSHTLLMPSQSQGGGWTLWPGQAVAVAAQQVGPVAS